MGVGSESELEESESESEESESEESESEEESFAKFQRVPVTRYNFNTIKFGAILILRTCSRNYDVFP